MTMRNKPPFRADHVGSLLRPAAIKTAREQHTKAVSEQFFLRLATAPRSLTDE